jgi:hypothetical protein
MEKKQTIVVSLFFLYLDNVQINNYKDKLQKLI